MSGNVKKQPWIYSPKVDGMFILAPALIVSAIALVFQDYFTQNHVTGLWAWVFLVVGIDVAHVYSTLYRTYFDRDELKARQTLYILVPLLGWLFFMMLYTIGPEVFWRVLAYLAVFHFVRQQYGLMMIYGRAEQGNSPASRLIDKMAIYSATIYPLIYWHTSKRNFQWFIEGDFFSFSYPVIASAAGIAYAGLLIAYAVKEVHLTRKTRRFNIPRNMLLLGTALSWFVGIVLLNSDIVFTFTNVIAHGIPYLALIWIYNRNQAQTHKSRKYLRIFTWEKFFSLQMLPVFIGLLVLLAYLEEGLWDSLVWREHGDVFGFLHSIPAITEKELLTIIVPLLALPQITHYLLDAFIWRMKDESTNWKKHLFLNSA